MNKVLVIGGGAAGMMAAVTAAACGASVTLAERNEKLGKKVYITGKGRCNVTNDCDSDTFLKNVVKNPRFLFSAFHALSPQDLMDWLEDHGCPVVVERGNRVFPESQKASDITRTFERELHRRNVRILLNTRIGRLLVEDGACTGAVTESGEILSADAVIICTGGQSYPSTGSTGDAWPWMRDCGHTVFPPLPSLTGLESPEAWIWALQGLSLKNVRLTLFRGKKKLYTELGEMLFTHFGVSGPLVLSASAYMAELDPSEVRLELNLKPGLNEEQLEARILRDIAEAPKKQISTLMCGLFPSRLAETMMQLCSLEGTRQSGSLTREERQKLIQNTLALQIPVSASRSLAEAIVTRGGISVKEMDASTMRSKLISGLFAAGEVLDTDALTGGFNLHIAFCTGYLAGKSAAEYQSE